MGRMPSYQFQLFSPHIGGFFLLIFILFIFFFGGGGEWQTPMEPYFVPSYATHSHISFLCLWIWCRYNIMVLCVGVNKAGWIWIKIWGLTFLWLCSKLIKLSINLTVIPLFQHWLVRWMMGSSESHAILIFCTNFNLTLIAGINLIQQPHVTYVYNISLCNIWCVIYLNVQNTLTQFAKFIFFSDLQAYNYPDDGRFYLLANTDQ